jgi:hypothetical protein
VTLIASTGLLVRAYRQGSASEENQDNAMMPAVICALSLSLKSKGIGLRELFTRTRSAQVKTTTFALGKSIYQLDHSSIARGMTDRWPTRKPQVQRLGDSSWLLTATIPAA